MRDMRAGIVPSGRHEVPAGLELLSAFARGKLGRRNFLKRSAAAGAGLVIAFYLPARGEDATAKDFAPNAWLQIEPSGKLSLWVARSEMGQGVRTAMAMIIAEELEADWKNVHIVQADSEAKYGDMITGGSASVRTGFDPLRKAGAAGREMLLAAAAKTWKIPVTECTARDEAIHQRGTKRALGYGALAEKAAALPVPKDPAVKDPKNFRIIGTSEPRVDGPKIVVGEAKYGVDTKLPGMLYAVIARPPVFSARVKKFDATKAMSVPGVKKVVEVPPIQMPSPFSFEAGKAGNQHVLPNGLAVLADSTWNAIQGRRALQIEWDDGGNAESTAGQRAKCAELAQKAGQEFGRVGEPEKAYENAARKIEAVYEVPFLAHTPMETPNCTAEFKDGHCTIWAPTQNAQGVLAGVASALGIETSAVTVHVTLLGGGFGRRLNIDYGVEAAVLSKAAGAPVKVFWTREDDIHFDYYRPMSLHRFRAGLDTENRVVAWMHHIVQPTTDGYYEGPETPDLGGSELAGPGVINGTVPNYLIEASFLQTAVPRGYLRAVDNIANQWAVQGFMDEIAAATKKDPVALRREIIGEWHELPAPKADEDQVDVRRLRKVLDFTAEKAGWGKDLGERRGRGIAALYAFNSYVSQVAEVTVAKDGTLTIDRVVLGIDCGRVVNPDIARSQLEGGVIFGLTGALFGEITIANGRVQQTNFNNYRMVRIGDVPKTIEIHFVESEEAPTGVGELGVPSLAPAIANAIFAATGKRVRRTPIQAALAEAQEVAQASSALAS
ncbi:MAG: xanthine dehydrogenase family protein molybdopterin-binding subunit [Candidatus Acidiferrales bacterium]